VKLDLERLRERHPRLPVERARDLSLHAAFALQRRHRSGVLLRASVRSTEAEVELIWEERAAGEALQLDEREVIELGAEAVALTLAHEVCGWVVMRRLQQGERADWLLEEQNTGRKLVLEVSGTYEEALSTRLNRKIEQICESSVQEPSGVCGTLHGTCGHTGGARMTRLDDLYTLVTDAIFRAERLERSGQARETALAYLEVSRLEEEIAAAVPASDVEGAIARRGVVTAALSAGDYVRAREIAERFAGEANAPRELVAELRRLRDQAQQKINEIVRPGGLAVVPVPFRLAPAA
jgi:hypothetical protein